MVYLSPEALSLLPTAQTDTDTAGADAMQDLLGSLDNDLDAALGVLKEQRPPFERRAAVPSMGKQSVASTRDVQHTRTSTAASTATLSPAPIAAAVSGADTMRSVRSQQIAPRPTKPKTIPALQASGAPLVLRCKLVST